MVVGLGVMAQPQDASAPHVDVIVIDGTINPAVDDFIRESIGRAKLNRAQALVIQLDTPGGLLTSTRTIVKEILGAPVPVIVYVSPSGGGAGSAGVFDILSGNVAKDIDGVLRQAYGRKVELEGRLHTLALKAVRIVRYEMSLKQRIINAIADPNIAYLFMMAGILGLYMEFSHPGVFFPGVAG